MRALIAARKAVKGTLYKAGAKTEGQGGTYKYVGHEHVVEHVRDAMLNNNLVLLQTVLHYESSEATKQSSVYRWRAEFSLMHVAGASLSFSFQGLTAMSDKASFIASTALDRTALLRIMGVAGTSDEDPEHNSNNREVSQQTSQARVQQMAAKRDDKQAALQQRKGVITDMISQLPKLDKYDGLVEWAAYLVAGSKELCGMRRAEKLPAWNAYGLRCEALGIDPSDTVNDYQSLAAQLRERGE